MFGIERSSEGFGDNNPFLRRARSNRSQAVGPAAVSSVDPRFDYDEVEAQAWATADNFDPLLQTSQDQAAAQVHAVQKVAQKELERLRSSGATIGAEYERLYNLARLGTPEPEENLLSRIIDIVDRPRMLASMAIADFAGKDAETGSEITGSDYWQALRGREDLLLDRHGEDLFGTDGRLSGSHMLQLFGLDESDTPGGKATRFLASLAAEVVLDPLTYVSFGTLGLGKKVAIEAAEASARKGLGAAVRAVRWGSEEVADDLARNFADDIGRQLDDEVASILGGFTDQAVTQRGKALADVVKSRMESGGLLPSESNLREILKRSDDFWGETVEINAESYMNKVAPAILAKDWANQSLRELQASQYASPLHQGGARFGVPFLGSRALAERSVAIPGTRGLGRKTSRFIFGESRAAQEALGTAGRPGLTRAATWLEPGGWARPFYDGWNRFMDRFGSNQYFRGVVTGQTPYGSTQRAVRQIPQWLDEVGVTDTLDGLRAGVVRLRGALQGAGVADDEIENLLRAMSSAVEAIPAGASVDDVLAAVYEAGGEASLTAGVRDEVASIVYTLGSAYRRVGQLASQYGVLDRRMDNYVPHILSSEMQDWLDKAIRAGLTPDPMSDDLGDQLLLSLMSNRIAQGGRSMSPTTALGNSQFAQERVIGKATTLSQVEGAEVIPAIMGQTVLLDREVLPRYLKGGDAPIDELNDLLRDAVQKLVGDTKLVGEPKLRGATWSAFEDNPLMVANTYLHDMQGAILEQRLIRELQNAGLVDDAVPLVNQQALAEMMRRNFGKNDAAAKAHQRFQHALLDATERKRMLEEPPRVTTVEYTLGDGLVIQIPEELADNKRLARRLEAFQSKGRAAEELRRQAIQFYQAVRRSLQIANPNMSDRALDQVATARAMAQVNETLKVSRQEVRELGRSQMAMILGDVATRVDGDWDAAVELLDRIETEVLVKEALLDDQAATLAEHFGKVAAGGEVYSAKEFEQSVWPELVSMNTAELNNLLQDALDTVGPGSVEIRNTIYNVLQGSELRDATPEELAEVVANLSNILRRHFSQMERVRQVDVVRAADHFNPGVGPTLFSRIADPAPADFGFVPTDDPNPIKYVYAGSSEKQGVRGAGGSVSSTGYTISAERAANWAQRNGSEWRGVVLVFRFEDMPPAYQRHVLEIREQALATGDGRLPLEGNEALEWRVGHVSNPDIEDVGHLENYNILSGMDPQYRPQPVAAIDGPAWGQATEFVYGAEQAKYVWGTEASDMVDETIRELTDQYGLVVMPGSMMDGLSVVSELIETVFKPGVQFDMVTRKELSEKLQKLAADEYASVREFYDDLVGGPRGNVFASMMPNEEIETLQRAMDDTDTIRDFIVTIGFNLGERAPRAPIGDHAGITFRRLQTAMGMAPEDMVDRAQTIVGDDIVMASVTAAWRDWITQTFKGKGISGAETSRVRRGKPFPWKMQSGATPEEGKVRKLFLPSRFDTPEGRLVEQPPRAFGDISAQLVHDELFDEGAFLENVAKGTLNPQLDEPVRIYTQASLRYRGVIDESGLVQVYAGPPTFADEFKDDVALVFYLEPVEGGQTFTVKAEEILADMALVMPESNAVLVQRGKALPAPGRVPSVRRATGVPRKRELMSKPLSWFTEQRFYEMFPNPEDAERAWAEWVERLQIIFASDAINYGGVIEGLRNIAGLSESLTSGGLIRSVSHFMDNPTMQQSIADTVHRYMPGYRAEILVDEAGSWSVAIVPLNPTEPLTLTWKQYREQLDAVGLTASEVKEAVGRLDALGPVESKVIQNRMVENLFPDEATRSKFEQLGLKTYQDFKQAPVARAARGLGTEVTKMIDGYTEQLVALQLLRGEVDEVATQLRPLEAAKAMIVDLHGPNAVVGAVPFKNRLINAARQSVRQFPLGDGDALLVEHGWPAGYDVFVELLPNHRIRVPIVGDVDFDEVINAEFRGLLDIPNAHMIATRSGDDYIEIGLYTSVPAKSEARELAVRTKGRFVELDPTGSGSWGRVTEPVTLKQAKRDVKRVSQERKAVDLLESIQASMLGEDFEDALAKMNVRENRRILKQVLRGDQFDQLRETLVAHELMKQKDILVPRQALQAQNAFFRAMGNLEKAAEGLEGLSVELRDLKIAAIDEEQQEMIAHADRLVELLQDIIGVGREADDAPLNKNLYPVDEVGRVTVEASKELEARVKEARKLAQRLGWDEITDAIPADLPKDWRPRKQGQLSVQVFGVGGRAASYKVTDPFTAGYIEHAVAHWQALTTPEGLSQFGQQLNWLGRAWKSMATVARPTFHVRNFVGAAWNNQIAQVGMQDYLWVRGRMLKLRRLQSQGRTLAQILDEFSPRDAEIIKAMADSGVLDLGFAASEFHRLGKVTRASVASRALDVGSQDWLPTRYGGELMMSIEDFMRAAAFHRWYDELGANGASSVVYAVHFDYTKLTAMEQKIKQVIPFYVWMKNNIALQMRVLLERPDIMVRYKALMNAVHDNFDTGDRAGWPVGPYDSQFSAGLGIELNGDTPFWARLIFDPDLPIKDLENMPAPENALSIGSWAAFAGNQLAPWFTAWQQVETQNEWGQAAAPQGFSQVLRGLSALGVTDTPVVGGEAMVGYGTRNLLNTAFPILNEYSNLFGVQNDPNRQAGLGIDAEDGVSLSERLRGSALQLLGGVGVTTITPQDANTQAARGRQEIENIVASLRRSGVLGPEDYTYDEDVMRRVQEILGNR